MITMVMVMMMIRMPRYYEGNQEEDKKEEEGEGVRHGRLFLVVIILIGTIFIIFILIGTIFMIFIFIMIFIKVIISANSITNNNSITVGVLLLLRLMWGGTDLPTNGLHFWPLWTSSFVASVILDDEGEDDDDVGHNDQCNADSAYFLPFWPL